MCLAAVLTALSGVVAAAATEHTEFYVATTGSDAQPGTEAAPFLTLERARDAIRQLKQQGPVTVWIKRGRYHRTTTFALTQQDSGSEDVPVVYRAHGDEAVHLIGGKELDQAWFRPVQDSTVLARLDADARGKVLQVDLRAVGVTDYGKPGLERRGLQLFCNDRWMPVARWPNDGWAHTVSSPDGDTHFVYAGDRPDRWRDAPDAQAAGYWQVEYSCREVGIAGVDPATNTITFTGKPSYGIKPAGGMPWYAFNLLEEIDSPGEWYLDRQRGILYLWPPADFNAGPVLVSVLSGPLIAMQQTSHVTFRGLTLEVSQGAAVSVEAGRGNLIAACVIRNVNRRAVSLSGTAHRVVGCDLYNLGAGAVSMAGGNRRKLTPGQHSLENCDIRDFATLHADAAAVSLQGVGQRVAHNSIRYGPRQAIVLSGNDHLIEFNEIHDVVLSAGDAGVIYTGRDWTYRGNVVRHNFFHHVPEGPGYGTRGVYIDDCASSVETFGNVFYRVPRAVFIGGGRDNIVANNIFIECGRPVNLDNRGLRWDSFRPEGDLYKQLERQAEWFTQTPWRERYPRLARILTEDPRAPRGNTCERNVSVRCDWRNPEEACRSGTGPHSDQPYMQVAHNLVVEDDPGFADAAQMNFQLADDSIVYRKVPGFQRIPFDRIGPFQDELRATWPVSSPRK